MKKLLLCLLLAGCASTDTLVFDSTPRPRTQSVEVFHYDQPEPVPSKKYKEIAEFVWVGPPQDGKKARLFFIAKAKKAGANAIIITRPDNFGSGGNQFQSNATLAHKAKAVVYE